ncbi:MAG TPA: hypothetical protein VLY85_02320 [Thermoplasmata archaeon]|nr:hypothetical protein [Thermoplasmata archaeon]
MPKGPLHHVSLEVSDVARARWFYDRFLVPLGFRRFTGGDDYVGYTDGTLTLWFLRSRRARVRRHPPTGDEEVVSEHLAFRLPSAAAVRTQEAALTRQELYPLFRGEEHPEFTAGYFSATWVDPDNIVLELYAIDKARGHRRATGARPRRSRTATRRRRTAHRTRARR